MWHPILHWHIVRKCAVCTRRKSSFLRRFSNKWQWRGPTGRVHLCPFTTELISLNQVFHIYLITRILFRTLNVPVTTGELPISMKTSLGWKRPKHSFFYSGWQVVSDDNIDLDQLLQKYKCLIKPYWWKCVILTELVYRSLVCTHTIKKFQSAWRWWRFP